MAYTEMEIHITHIFSGYKPHFVIHVTGKARATLTRLTQHSPSLMYQQTIVGLQQRFDPPCRRELHKRMLEHRTRCLDKDWADFGDALMKLVDQAYPNL